MVRVVWVKLFLALYGVKVSTAGDILKIEQQNRAATSNTSYPYINYFQDKLIVLFLSRLDSLILPSKSASPKWLPA